MRATQTATAFLVFGAALSLAAQSSTPPPATPQGPTFRTGTNLVLVDVYPMKDGRILQNLEIGDFTVLEDGKPQKVENLQFVTLAGRTPDSEKRDPNSQAEGNQLAADPKNRVFVVYLDTKGVSIEGAYRSRQPLIDMLNRITAPNDLFGVLTTETEPSHLTLGRKVQTTDEMLAKHWPWGTRGSVLRTDEEQAMNVCTTKPPSSNPGEDPTMYVEDHGMRRKMIDVMIERLREDRTLTHLEATIDHLSRIRETRTALIVFTEGWVLVQPDYNLLAALQVFSGYDNGPAIGAANGRPMLRPKTGQNEHAACLAEMTRLANLDNRTRFNGLLRNAARSNVVFYPVNPAGLQMFDFPIQEKVTPAPDREKNLRPNMLLLEQLDRLKFRADGMLQAAETTGGIAVVNTNKIEEGLDRIAAQLESYYVLGYYSTNPVADGKYRQITVKLKTPGVDISARKGYTALTKTEAATVNAPRPVVPAAVAADESARAEALGALSRIRGSAELYGWGVHSKPGEIAVIAEVSGQLAERGQWLGGGDLQAIVTTGAGEVAGSGRAKLDPGARGVAVRVPVSGDGPWQVQLRLRNGEAALETTASVKPMSREDALLGDPIVFRVDPGGVQAARPVADFLFRRTERVHIEWAMRGQIDARQARLLDRAGNALPIGVTIADKPGSLLAADLILGALAPGDYVIELTASGPTGTTRKLVAIRVQNN